MPSTPRNRLGEVYGKLTVVRPSERRTRSGNTFWWCQCQCGNEREVPSYSLSNKKRSRKNITACHQCSKELVVEGVYIKNDREELERRKQAILQRSKLRDLVPLAWLDLALTDQDARQKGEKLFFRGTRCLNGHLSPYRINGGCLQCSKEKTLK